VLRQVIIFKSLESLFHKLIPLYLRDLEPQEVFNISGLPITDASETACLFTFIQ